MKNEFDPYPSNKNINPGFKEQKELTSIQGLRKSL